MKPRDIETVSAKHKGAENVKPYCCYLDPVDGKRCTETPKFVITPDEPYSHTHVCAQHLPELLPDGGAFVSFLKGE